MGEGAETARQPVAVTLADRVRRTAADRPERVAFHHRDRALTWAELDRAIDGAAADLLCRTGESRPVPDGGAAPVPGGGSPVVAGTPARVAIALGNTPEFVIALLATMRAGLVAVPVNPGAAGPELRHVLADSQAAVLLATERVGGLVEPIRADLPALQDVHIGLAASDGPGGTDPGQVVAAPDPDDLAVLLYTAGTEGRPKGAMLTHRCLLANHEQLGGISPPVVGPDDVLLLALPLFHAYGLGSGLGAVAYHGACGVLIDDFDPADALDRIARHRVTILLGVPSMFLAWSLLPNAGTALAAVRLAVCGAAPLDAGTADRFAVATGHPPVVGYGLTEAAPVLTSTLASPAPKRGSIGRPLPGVRIRLVGAGGERLWSSDPDDPDLDAEADDWELDPESAGTDPGEIVVRGANLFAGYWPDGRGGPGADGWWATGDIAYADADGDLFLVDRLGELILVNGFNVYPREVELALDAHPEVLESAVTAAPHPYTGQTVRAYVVRAPGAGVTEAVLRAHCAERLARFKCPTAVEFVDALPHSAIGKVRKTLLRPAPGQRDGRSTAEVADG
ncbi:AMP-binding protein [Plantactinospora siamensis]|uniref:AMP-binding protein n=1 Tax=Plantactinospora siamensis TaxID=555372 RepID=A0ABV6P5S8_9ACTN